MKFDLIVGNPPYQRATKSTAKIYQDMTPQIFDLLVPGGEMAWVMPASAHLPSNRQRIPEISQQYLIHIDYTSDVHFTVGHKIATYNFTNTIRTDDIEVKQSDGNIYLTDSIAGIADTGMETFLSILKVFHSDEKFHGYGYNKFNRKTIKLAVATTTDAHWVRDCDTTGKYVVRTNGKSKPDLYTNVRKNPIGNKRLVYHFIGDYQDGGYITDDEITSDWIHTQGTHTDDYLENLQTYMSSKVVCYLMKHFAKYKGYPHAIFYNRLVGLDFTKPWTDNEIYDAFGLDAVQVDHIETWSAANKVERTGDISKWKKCQNHLTFE